jgi:hypothetical protein
MAGISKSNKKVRKLANRNRWGHPRLTHRHCEHPDSISIALINPFKGLKNRIRDIIGALMLIGVIAITVWVWAQLIQLNIRG